MKNLLKLALVALCISVHSNSNAMYHQRNDDYVGPVVSGMVAGWAYERFLYRLPILLGLPTATVAFLLHAINSQGYSESQANVTGIAALATAVILYNYEKPEQKEIVIVHQPYPVEMREHHHHHKHGHHHE